MKSVGSHGLAIALMIGALSAVLGGGPARAGVSQTMRPATVDLRVAALLLSGQQGGSLPLAVFAYPAPLQPAAGWLVQVDVDGTALIAAGLEAEAGLDLDVFIYALGPDSAVLASSARRLTVTLDELRGEGPESRPEGLRVCDRLEIPPADHPIDLRLLVSVDEKTFGLRRQRIGGSGGEAMPPLVVEGDRWLTAMPPPLAGRLGELLPAPWWRGEARRLPASRPLAVPGRWLQAQLFPPASVAGPDRGSDSLSARLQPVDGTEDVTLLALEDGVLEDGVLEDGALGATSVADRRPGRTVELEVPELAAGFYELSFSWGEKVETPSITVFVPDVAAALPVPVVPARADTGAERAGERARESAPRRVDPGVVDDLAMSYHGLLETFASAADASPAGFVERLRALEKGALETLGDAAFDALERAQKRFTARLDAGEWRAALPLILLHAGAVKAHRQGGEFALALHAAHRTTALATSYAGALDTPEARGHAALVLLDLASYFLRHGPLGRAEDLYRRTLEIVPRDGEALLRLAVLLEKEGRHGAALTTLRQLVEAHPDGAEGRLRLAVNLHRAGRTAEARETFASLTAAGSAAPAWVAVLAHQELARLEVDAGRDEDAVEVLRRALGHWPEEPGLRLQLAHLQQRRGGAGGAAELLEGFESLSLGQRTSPRARYNRWPGASAAPATRLAPEAEEARARLRGLLAASAGSRSEVRK